MARQKYILIIFLLLCFNRGFAQDSLPGLPVINRSVGESTMISDREMALFVDDLMKKMTLEEKIGQLNLCTGGQFFTGPAVSKDNKGLIRQGKVGAILNTFGVENVTALQKLAVDESRLGIPLIFGLDVVHGFRTIFPIPLAQACSWDLEAIERSERIAADGGYRHGHQLDICSDGRHST